MATIHRRSPPGPSLVTQLRESRFSGGVRCPRCGHERVHRWGSFSGRQRYRCQECLRTFSDLTGTPAAYLKKIDLLPAYGRCLAASLSIRRSARRLGIDPSTAFRWRHRILDGLRHHGEAEKLSGWIEVACWWVPECRKGERDLDRPPSRRRRRYLVLREGPCVAVVVACDRRGHVISTRSGRVTADPLPPTAAQLVEALESRLEGRACLIPSAEMLPSCRGAARRLRAPLHEDIFRRPVGVVASRRGTSPVHVHTARDYVKRLRRWLEPFRGVATKYLPNYLLWHRRLDASVRHRIDVAMLRWPLSV